MIAHFFGEFHKFEDYHHVPVMGTSPNGFPLNKMPLTQVLYYVLETYITLCINRKTSLKGAKLGQAKMPQPVPRC